MMKKSILLILTILQAVCLTSCKEITKELGLDADVDFLDEILGQKRDQIKIMDIHFSSDYKTFSLTSDILQDIGPYRLEDTTQVRTEVVETINGMRAAHFSTPRLRRIENIEAERIHEYNLRLLVLVNRTLPQADLDRIRNYVGEMRTAFNYDNLFVAFMDTGTVTKSIKVTDYVMDNYFKKSAGRSVYLYRSILQKREEMCQGKDIWQDAKALFLLTFSNEKVYIDDTDEPIDPNHYLYEEQMVSPGSATDTPVFTAFYVSVAQHQPGESEHEENVLRIFCKNSGGSYMNNFNWVTCKGDMLSTVHLTFPDYLYYFENPDFKVYRGDNKKLTLNFYNNQNDSLIATASTTVTLGEPFNPIIVHGHPIGFVILKGIFLGLFLMLLVYLVMQFIIPAIKYLLFQRKYVIRYTGQNMSLGNRAIQESCYFCKAPFETGDLIVVKCEHSMHKACWLENGHHCPEYSDRCKHGSHYYNTANLFDGHNASFYLKWFLMAIGAATLSWIIFILYAHFTSISPLYASITQMPEFGLFIGFFLTFGITTLTFRPGGDASMFLHILLRAVVASVGCYLSFLLINAIIYLFNINNFTSLLNWIPWTLSGFAITYCSTFATRIKHSKRFLFVSVLLGALCMYVWSLFFSYMEKDFRVLLLLCFIVFSISVVACIAKVAPRSERYFLKVQGATKEMDIALYKWFRNNHGQVVSIGKSVDCSLQLSWDIQSEVAPVQAEIRLIKKTPYLLAMEPGVFISGKPVRVGKKVRLYHGTTFVIGRTTFTYIEKDR